MEGMTDDHLTIQDNERDVTLLYVCDANIE